MSLTILKLSPVPLVDPDAPKGSWHRYTYRDGSPGHVSIKCPFCGAVGCLRDAPGEKPWRKDGTNGHDIADDGTVSPSMVCPDNAAGKCPWHVYGRLADWVPYARIQ